MKRLDVRAMLAGMTASEFAEWEASSLIDPWGAEVEDHRFGVLAAAIVNFAGKVLKGSKKAVPTDFFPSRAALPEEQEKPKSARELRAKIAAAWGTPEKPPKRRGRHG